MIMRAGRAILEILKGYGVTDVFGLPGETTLALYREWEDFPEIGYHMCRDERSSVFMADAYAKASGRVGVCEGPSVGSTHMIPGIAEAFQSCVPLLCVTTDIPLEFGTKNMLTGCDQTALFKSVTKDTYTVNKTSELPHLFRRAFRTAVTGRPGPVHIRIPCDILDGDVPDGEVYVQARYGTFPAVRSRAADDDVEAAAAAIAAAKRPLLICGQGAVHSGAWTEVARLAEQQEMPVGSTINAKGIFAETHPLALGVIGARGGRQWNNGMVQEADLILFAGSSTDSANTDGWTTPSPESGQTFIQIDAAERELGNNYDALPLFGDARETLRALIAALSGRKRPDRGAWAGKAAAGRAAHEKRLLEIIKREGEAIHPLSLVRAIEEAAPDDTFYAVDPGISAIYSSGFLRLKKAGRRMAYNFSMGALGYAIPASIGARYGTAKEAPVVALVGDGSFGFCAGELETAARLGVKAVYIMFNNGGFGWIRGTEYVHTGSPLSPGFSRFTDFAGVDYVKFAESFGIKGFRAENMTSFREIFAGCLAENGPCLIDVPVKPQEEQLPPVPGWAASKVAKSGDMIY